MTIKIVNMVDFYIHIDIANPCVGDGSGSRKMAATAEHYFEVKTGSRVKCLTDKDMNRELNAINQESLKVVNGRAD